jgi:hypothetical protein
MTRNKNKHKTKIDWDLNVFCPEQWYGLDKGTFWDHEHWLINARIYDEGKSRDTRYTITLLEKEARALGLVDFAKVENNYLYQKVMDYWLDAGLDGMISLYHFNRLYRDKCSDRILEFLDTLPQYMEDVPEHMVY